MKKQNMMMVALMMMAAGAVHANPSCGSKSEAQACALSTDEQAFTAKLGENQKKAFMQMNADQRKAAMTAAADPSLGANGAVDKVAKDTHVSASDAKKAEVK